jgi:hypothetical protein
MQTPPPVGVAAPRPKTVIGWPLNSNAVTASL